MRGRSRQYVAIEEQSGTDINGFGEPVENWTTFANAWVYVSTMSGREFIQAKEIHAELSHILTTRYIDGVHPKMRVSYNGRTLDILAAFDADETRRELKIYCREQV